MFLNEFEQYDYATCPLAYLAGKLSKLNESNLHLQGSNGINTFVAHDKIGDFANVTSLVNQRFANN